jgi:hypothetical protein
MRPFWRWLALYAYRRWARPGTPKPVGIPGNRDPDNPCHAYEPRTWRFGDWKDCRGDGHYLCHECVHREERPQEESA